MSVVMSTPSVYGVKRITVRRVADYPNAIELWLAAEDDGERGERIGIWRYGDKPVELVLGDGFTPTSAAEADSYSRAAARFIKAASPEPMVNIKVVGPNGEPLEDDDGHPSL